jgi:hypothetical protein
MRRAALGAMLILLGLTACAFSPEAPAAPPSAPPASPTSQPTPTATALPRHPDFASLVIEPGGLGSLRIGHPVTETDMVEHRTDCATLDESPRDGWAGAYPEVGSPNELFLVEVTDGLVAGISVRSHELSTASGVRLGTPIQELQHAYPDLAAGPSDSWRKTYFVESAEGRITFEVPDTGNTPEDDVVALITVARAGFDVTPHYATDVEIGCVV